MKIIMLSLDSATEAQCAALWNEVERALGSAGDPLEELIAEEEELDLDLAVRYLNGLHRRVRGRDCTFPKCRVPERRCCKGCVHRDRVAR